METRCYNLTHIATAIDDRPPFPLTAMEEALMQSIRARLMHALSPQLRKAGPLTFLEVSNLKIVQDLGLTPKQISDNLVHCANAGLLVKAKSEATPKIPGNPINVYSLPDMPEATPREGGPKVFSKPKPVKEAEQPEPVVEAKSERKPRKPGRYVSETELLEAIRAKGSTSVHDILDLIEKDLGMHRAYASTKIGKLCARGVMRKAGAHYFIVADEKRALKEKRAEEARQVAEAERIRQEAENPTPPVEAEPIAVAQIAPRINGHTIEPQPMAYMSAETTQRIYEDIGRSISAIAQGIAEQIAAQVGGLVVQALTQLKGSMPTASDAPAYAAQAQKVFKPKVCVLGLLPAQAGMMQTEFPAFDFTFVTADQMSRAPQVAKGSDRIFGMTNFINHSMEGQVKHHPGYTRISGGMSALREALRTAQT